MRERFKELDLGSRFISDQQMIIDNLYDDQNNNWNRPINRQENSKEWAMK